MNRLTKYQIFRLSCLIVLWMALCWIVISSRPVTPMTIFVIIASGIIVFVPLYKKYIKKDKDERDSDSGLRNGRK